MLVYTLPDGFENGGQLDERHRGVDSSVEGIQPGKHTGYGSDLVGRGERIRTSDPCLPKAIPTPIHSMSNVDNQLIK